MQCSYDPCEIKKIIPGDAYNVAPLLELAALVLAGWRKDVVPITFRDGEAAWKVMLRADPDLLITDMLRGGMSGFHMLPLLAERKVQFPILVTSAVATEEQVLECAGPNLKVTCLQKPYEAQPFMRYLSAHLGPGDDSG